MQFNSAIRKLKILKNNPKLLAQFLEIILLFIELICTPRSILLDVHLRTVLRVVGGDYFAKAKYAALVDVKMNHPFIGSLIQAVYFLPWYPSIVV